MSKQNDENINRRTQDRSHHLPMYGAPGCSLKKFQPEEIQSNPGPHFLVFRLNMENCKANVQFQSQIWDKTEMKKLRF